LAEVDTVLCIGRTVRDRRRCGEIFIVFSGNSWKFVEQLEVAFAYGQGIAWVYGSGLDSHAVHFDAVSGSQVLNGPISHLEAETKVLARNVGIFHLDITRGAPPQNQIWSVEVYVVAAAFWN
jgi:hypothetical protein